MNIKFLRVMGTRSHQPSVVAIADETRVKWNRHGWSCDCDDWQLGDDNDTCPHVEAVCSLLDPRVTGESVSTEKQQQ